MNKDSITLGPEKQLCQLTNMINSRPLCMKPMNESDNGLFTQNHILMSQSNTLIHPYEDEFSKQLGKMGGHKELYKKKM